MDKLFRQQTGKYLRELFFPSFCLGCQLEGTYLCQDCQSTLEISEYNYCLCNKQPFRIPAGELRGKCNRCQDRKLSGLYSALPYQEKALTRKLIYQFKYVPYIKNLAKPLAAILAEHLIKAGNNKEAIWENSILVPVPLEKGKLKSRGYNQAEVLAKELSQLINVPVATDNLVKIKKTESQMKLSAKERQENLKDAFSIKDNSHLAGKKIFLIDDVYTTGATMEACAHVLRTQGRTKSVWGLAIAREE